MTNQDILDSVLSVMIDHPDRADEVAEWVEQGGLGEMFPDRKRGAKSIPPYRTKDNGSHEGEACQRGWTEQATGCTPAAGKGPGTSGASAKPDKTTMVRDAIRSTGLNLRGMGANNEKQVAELVSKLRSKVDPGINDMVLKLELRKLIKEANSSPEPKKETAVAKESASAKPNAGKPCKPGQNPEKDDCVADDEEEEDENEPDEGEEEEADENSKIAQEMKRRLDAIPERLDHEKDFKSAELVDTGRTKLQYVFETDSKGKRKKGKDGKDIYVLNPDGSKKRVEVPIMEWRVDGKILPEHLLTKKGIEEGTGTSKVPVGWKNVEVNMNPKARVIIKGEYEASRSDGEKVVKKGSTLNPKYQRAKAGVKFYQVGEFIKQRDQIEAKIVSDMKHRDPAVSEPALVAMLVLHNGTRPGSNTDTRGLAKYYHQTVDASSFVVKRTKLKKKNAQGQTHEVTASLKVQDASGKVKLIKMKPSTAVEIHRRIEAGESFDSFDSTFWLQSWGATTLQPRHVVQKKDGVYIEFVGKKGVWQSHKVQSEAVAQEMLKRKSKMHEDADLFNRAYASEGKLGQYVHTFGDGGFITYNMRTSLATIMAKAEIDKVKKKPKSLKEYKEAVRKVADVVCARLGNNWGESLKSYIDPTLWDSWRNEALGLDIYESGMIKASSLPRTAWKMLEPRTTPDMEDVHSLFDDTNGFFFEDPDEDVQSWREALASQIEAYTDDELDLDDPEPDEAWLEYVRDMIGFDVDAEEDESIEEMEEEPEEPREERKMGPRVPQLKSLRAKYKLHPELREGSKEDAMDVIHSLVPSSSFSNVIAMINRRGLWRSFHFSSGMLNVPAIERFLRDIGVQTKALKRPDWEAEKWWNSLTQEQRAEQIEAWAGTSGYSTEWHKTTMKPFGVLGTVFRETIIQEMFPSRKKSLRYRTKDQAGNPAGGSARGKPCEQGQTATRDGCIPASGETQGTPAARQEKPEKQEHATDEKQKIKEIMRSIPVPESLPDNPEDYFKITEDSVTIPLDKIHNLRQRPQGVENAARFMEGARLGKLPKRSPIKVVKNPDGSYTVADGNSTFANAKRNGWESIPAQIVSREWMLAEQKKTVTKETNNAEKLMASELLFTPEELNLGKSAENQQKSQAAIAEIAPEVKEEYDTALDRGQGVEKVLGATVLDPLQVPKDEWNEKETEALSKPGIVVILAPNKKLDARGKQKVDKELKGNWGLLNDVVRGTVGVDFLSQIPQTIKTVRAEMEKRGFTLVKTPKNRFGDKPTAEGYRDVNLSFRSPQGLITEVQINTKPLLLAKKDGHKLYEVERDLIAASKTRPLTDEEITQGLDVIGQQRDQYTAAYLRSLGVHEEGNDELVAHARKEMEDKYSALWEEDMAPFRRKQMMSWKVKSLRNKYRRKS
jgi:hypothetical protein